LNRSRNAKQSEFQNDHIEEGWCVERLIIGFESGPVSPEQTQPENKPLQSLKTPFP